MYRHNEDVRIEERPKPAIVEATDAVVRITTAAICGSDLHIYHGDIPDTKSGDVLGHEAIGIVEEVGSAVRRVKRGDRVVISAIVACGTCRFCRDGWFSLCDRSNPNPLQMEMFGYHMAAALGYSHLAGGLDGDQAEYVRVPYADVGLLPVPDDVTDERAVLLADTACTGFHAAAMSKVGPGSSVAVFGCGPIGLMAMRAAQMLGAESIIAFDRLDYRLRFAREKLGVTALNVEEDDPVRALREMTSGVGPDVCIEAAGFRYARTAKHGIEQRLKLETDAVDALSDAIRGVRKAGVVAAIGDFIGFANHFPIGAVMEKGLTLWGSQVPVQRYWHELLERIRRGEYDPTFVVTHRYPLEKAAEAYELFDRKQDGVIKVLLTA